MGTEQLTQASVQEWFDYDADTGVLTCKAEYKFTIWKNGTGYLYVRVGNKDYRVHRVIWLHVYGELPKVIDHINGNRTDNRLNNLRGFTVAANNLNLGKHRDGIPPFVRFHKLTGKWEAYLSKTRSPTNKKMHLGLYESKEEAASAVANVLNTIK